MRTKSRDRISPPIVGASALLVVFAVLCLVVFALLSLSTVQAERRLSDASRDAVVRYYSADLEAQRIFARLRRGETVPGVQQEGGKYAYTCAISENQTLFVELEQTGTTWKILRWQCMAQQGEMDETLPVWDGA